MKTYEWAVVGSGIAGITTAEILTREGHSVVLIEKNNKLASETTRDFHEWLHTGSLYTLIPDKLKTLRFILGAIDDLTEFYSSFDGMNIKTTSSGLDIKQLEGGWFNNHHINFKYRIKGRKVTTPWLLGVARSINLINQIHKHDWLRRRAGELEPFKKNSIRNTITIFRDLLRYKEKFYTLETPDCTINSRNLLQDLVASSIENGLEISINNAIKKIDNKNGLKILVGEKEDISAENVALCNGASIKNFSEVKVKTTYAPIAVVSGVPEDYESFVELDYFQNNCINILNKGNGMGLAGGISLSDKKMADEYLDKVFKAHKKLEPKLIEVSRYTGIKSEITFKNEPRGYLYHIVRTGDDIWALIPGKFTLSFSMAPEFYRRVYNKNPRKYLSTIKSNIESKKIVSNTVWMDKLKKIEGKNGIN